MSCKFSTDFGIVLTLKERCRGRTRHGFLHRQKITLKSGGSESALSPFHLEVLIFSAEKYVFRRKSPLLAPPDPTLRVRPR